MTQTNEDPMTGERREWVAKVVVIGHGEYAVELNGETIKSTRPWRERIFAEQFCHGLNRAILPLLARIEDLQKIRKHQDNRIAQLEYAVEKPRDFRLQVLKQRDFYMDEVERMQKERDALAARAEMAGRLFKMVPRPPNAISYEQGWAILDEIQKLAQSWGAIKGDGE